MDASKFEIKALPDGMEVVVRNSLANPELHAECVRLGLEPTAGIRNRRSIIVRSQGELDAVREPLRRFF